MSDNYKKYLKYKQKYLNLKQMHGGKKAISCPNYIIFSGNVYYPTGGWEDFYDTAETLANAKHSYRNAIDMNGWAHVVDMTSKKIILNSWPKK